nr:Chain D, Rcc1 [Homo sapiens]5E1D_E Chain E, Rcc1 [Homo sapiens]
YPKRIA